MKFVLAYTLRSGGSAAENASGGEAAQKLLANWAPSQSATMHQWLQRCDGNGGFAVVETDNAAELYRDVATWTPWLEFQIYPVVDIQDATALTQEALNTVRTVL
jgi:hypothetical protein